MLLEDEPGIMEQVQGRFDQTALVGHGQAQALPHAGSFTDGRIFASIAW